MNGNWHAVAKRFFVSLRESGQVEFYEPSDWALAEVLAESLSRELSQGGPVSPSALAQLLKGMSMLLVSEPDRRRAGVEVKRVVESASEENVTWMDQARKHRSGRR